MCVFIRVMIVRIISVWLLCKLRISIFHYVLLVSVEFYILPFLCVFVLFVLFCFCSFVLFLLFGFVWFCCCYLFLFCIRFRFVVVCACFFVFCFILLAFVHTTAITVDNALYKSPFLLFLLLFNPPMPSKLALKNRIYKQYHSK